MTQLELFPEESHEQTRELPKGWLHTSLECCVDILDSQRIPINQSERDARTDGKSESELVPYYGATGQVGWIDGYLFDTELLLLGEDGAPFFDKSKSISYVIRGRSWVNNHAHVLKGIEGLTYNSYIGYYLDAFDFHGYVTGTTRLKLNQGSMKNIPVPLAPINEQRRIVEAIETLFTRLDAGVDALKRLQKNLERYKASVLKAACEGKLLPQNPEDEPASELLKRILVERRAKWEAEELARYKAKSQTPPKGWQSKYQEPTPLNTDGLPELPDGWVWTEFDSTSEVQGGIQKQPKRTPKNNAFPYLRVANVQRWTLDLSEVYQMELFGDELDKLRLNKGDLLIVEGNGSPDQIGRSALWMGEIEDCVHQNHIIRVRFNHISPQFVSYYLNSPKGVETMMRIASSTSGLHTLSVSKVKALTFPLPPLHEQDRIIQEVERAFSIINETTNFVLANLKRAERLRQSILKEAFSGRLVPQDPSDEPASELLKRIKAERKKR